MIDVRTLLPIPSDEDTKLLYDSHGNVTELLRYVETVAKGPSGAGVIIGNYGFGKTHTMLHVASQVKANFKDSLVTYVNTPGSSFMNLYRAFINLMLRDSELLSKVTTYLEYPLRETLTLILSGGEDGGYARQWLMGEPAPQNFRLKHELGSRVNDELALRFMVNLGDVAVKAGYSPILILIDELEDMVTIGQVKRLQYLSLLRNLIDNLPGKTLLLAASTPAGWDEVVNTYPALARRLSSFVIYLKPFTYEESLEFVGRLVKWRGLDMDISENVVKVIHDYTEGNPGEIVRAISLIYTSLGGKVNVDGVKEVLSRHV